MKIDLVTTKKELGKAKFRDYDNAKLKMHFKIDGKSDVYVDFFKMTKEMPAPSLNFEVGYSYIYEGHSYSSNNKYNPAKIKFDDWISLYKEAVVNSLVKEIKTRERYWLKSGIHLLKDWVEKQENLSFTYDVDINGYRCPYPERHILGCAITYSVEDIAFKKQYHFEMVGKKYRVGYEKSSYSRRRRKRYNSNNDISGAVTLEQLKDWLARDLVVVAKSAKEQHDKKVLENDILNYLRNNFMGCAVKKQYGDSWQIDYPKVGNLQPIVISFQTSKFNINEYEPLEINQAQVTLTEKGIPLSKVKSMVEMALASFTPNPRFAKNKIRRVEIADGRIGKFEGMDFNERR